MTYTPGSITPEGHIAGEPDRALGYQPLYTAGVVWIKAHLLPAAMAHGWLQRSPVSEGLVQVGRGGPAPCYALARYDDPLEGITEFG